VVDPDGGTLPASWDREG